MCLFTGCFWDDREAGEGRWANERVPKLWLFKGFLVNRFGPSSLQYPTPPPVNRIDCMANKKKKTGGGGF